MLDEVNTTSSHSPKDFAMTLQFLSDAELQEVTTTQFWCWKQLQNQEINYQARYHACKLEQFVRSKKRNHANI
jgi:hypothetical protein